MNFKRVKITTTIPSQHANALREALGKAGAGVVGDYHFCSFSVIGKGRFTPGASADPHIGEPGKAEVVEEEQVQVTCGRDQAKQVIAALRAAHPYEEPIVEISPLVAEEEL